MTVLINLFNSYQNYLDIESKHYLPDYFPTFYYFSTSRSCSWQTYLVSTNCIEFDDTIATFLYRNRRLKAVWTMEAQQDLLAMHGQEIQGINELQMEINAEIDAEIIRDLRALI